MRIRLPEMRSSSRLASTLGCAAALLSWAAVAGAVSTGIATTSFPVPAQGCNFCHSGGMPPTVVLECADCGGAPPVVEPMSVHEFRVTVFEIGLQDHAGLNVSSPTGTLSTGGAFAAGTQTITGTGSLAEITHTTPKAATGGLTEFSFLWTAPASTGTATLAGWGNAVNFLGSTAGDAASSRRSTSPSGTTRRRRPHARLRARPPDAPTRRPRLSHDRPIPVRRRFGKGC